MNSGHIEHCPETNLSGAHGVVMQVENLGRGVYAVLIGGVILSSMLAGMALMRAEAISERASLAERQAALAREDIRIMQIALSRRGIETDEHEGEK